MFVLKFGGTSVGCGEMISKVADIVTSLDGRKVVVVSAMGGVTNRIIEVAGKVIDLPTDLVEKEVDGFHRAMVSKHLNALAEAVPDAGERGKVDEHVIELLDKLRVALLGVGYLEELSPKSLDYIMSFGERLSAPIVAAALSARGSPALALTGYEAGLVTDSNFGAARPKHKESKSKVKKTLQPLLSKGVVPVVTGFIAGDDGAHTTTLGRGGSDYTASLIGNYLGAKEVQIWTDVDGILSTDPKLVKAAKLIPEMSYVEAMDLAYFGAKVIHSKMIEPAMIANIPVRVKNTFSPDAEGTLIVHKQKAAKDVIKAVAVSKDVAIINLGGVGMAETPNVAGKIFSALGEGGVNILVISGSSESSLSFVVAQKDLEKSVEQLNAVLGDNSVRCLTVMEDVCIVTLVGSGMAGTKGIAAKVFSTVAKAGVNVIMVAQGSSEVNIAFMVKAKDVKKTVKALHERFVK